MFQRFCVLTIAAICVLGCERDMDLMDLNDQSVLAKNTSNTSAQDRYKFDYPTPNFILENREDLLWGINGHPLRPSYINAQGEPVDNAYKENVTYEEQVALLAELGVSVYRLDVHVNEDGSLGSGEKKEDLIRVLELLDSENMTALPVIYITDNNSDYNTALSKDELIARITSKSIKNLDLWNQNYQKGYTKGQVFGQEFKDKINYYQIGNEGALRIIGRTEHPNNVSNIKNTEYFYNTVGSGSERHHFFETSEYIRKVVADAAISSGLIDGLKSVDNNAKCIVNGTRMHYGYLKLFEELDVNYDLVGYNWYWSMGPITNCINDLPNQGLIGGTNIYQNLLQLSNNKDIWITEINKGRGSINYEEQNLDRQADDINASIRAMYNLEKVKAYIVYELLDLYSDPNTNHRHLGLYNTLAESGEEKKPAFNTMKYTIEEMKYGYHDIMFSYYQLYTGRTLDITNNSGLDYWADLLKSGRGLEGMFYDILKLDAKVFIKEAYELYLDRSPDPIGLSYYETKMKNENWSREKVIGDICSSLEFWNKAQNDNNVHFNPSVNFLERVHRKFFNRGVPLRNIRNSFENNREERRSHILSSDVLESEEFKRNFIVATFQKLLERTPDQNSIDPIIDQWGSQNRRIVAILISNEFWRKSIIRGYLERRK
ncbi:DUF4214 domain-containing protein [Aquimarina litoralis]|uniref:DUF4214 domain-containing protein n=1 Tax=Aquimarina litoralis TaxID=584605 RepID=UPI001C59C812|nr:DUF4214 domain-containing protein [Aquimarina litoralis]MBW1296865.1 DUF4214 domain-containing protein [Aquimarina litoralis]